MTMRSVMLPILAVAGTAAASGVTYAGVNICGFDFGVTTDGYDTTAGASPPLASLGGADGAGQMRHFVDDDHMNMFRLPVGWQYLLNGDLGGTLDATAFGRYDALVRACLDTGAHCIVDVHNYARWNGKIINHAGGPSNAQFVSLWAQLAARYATERRVVFGLMNEPHDLGGDDGGANGLDAWRDTVQRAVAAIRAAASAQQLILLPGSSYAAAGALPAEAGPGLLAVTNPDGTTDGLVFDVHKYYDADGAGTAAACVENGIASAFAPLAAWLRAHGRQALVTETGGGNTASCVQYVCEAIAYLNANADVFLGYLGWGAGAFDPGTYALSLVPTANGRSWTDTALVRACLARGSGR